MNTKLVLIDGIPGTGKSSTAQYIHLNLLRGGIANKWHHEEESGHPLFYPDANIQVIDWEEGLKRFIKTWPAKWDNLYKMVAGEREVHIITSYLLQDGARVLFNNMVPNQQIMAFCRDLVGRISRLDPVFVFMHAPDVRKLMRRTFKARGEDWKEYFISFDQRTKYAQARELTGERASVSLWHDFQQLCEQLYEVLDMRKVRFEVLDDNWPEIHTRLENVLEFAQTAPPGVDESRKGFYPGDYHEIRDHGLKCRIWRDSEEYRADFLWPGLPLIPVGRDLFAIRSLPVLFRFKWEGVSARIEIKGPGFYDITGKTLYKVS
ncbi:MAG: hypothetical protein ACLFQB_11205 [Chitinispirillaceae bacterium]